MASGGLVPDDVVIGIISDRLDQTDAARGFVLDGFPRTVPQAQALDELLKKKHMKLDAVVELSVNESALLARVESRVAEMLARGEQVRVDDTPELLSKRLASYRALTEPLIHYYSERRKLLTVDGMMTIEHVTREINRILTAIGVVSTKSRAKAGAAKSPGKAAGKGGGSAASAAGNAKKAARTAGKPGKPASRAAKKPERQGGSRSGRTATRMPKKSTKKLTKKRAKA